jgi:hypothetical protein
MVTLSFKSFNLYSSGEWNKLKNFKKKLLKWKTQEPKKRLAKWLLIFQRKQQAHFVTKRSIELQVEIYKYENT